MPQLAILFDLSSAGELQYSTKHVGVSLVRYDAMSECKLSCGKFAQVLNTLQVICDRIVHPLKLNEIDLSSVEMFVASVQKITQELKENDVKLERLPTTLSIYEL